MYRSQLDEICLFVHSSLSFSFTFRDLKNQTLVLRGGVPGGAGEGIRELVACFRLLLLLLLLFLLPRRKASHVDRALLVIPQVWLRSNEQKNRYFET